MVNLKGFCGADPSACGYMPGMPPPPTVTPADAANSSYGQKVLNFVYRLAAFLGCRGVCPAVPALVRVAIDLAGIPEAIIVAGESGGVGGVLVEIGVDQLGQLLGEFLQQELCSRCQ